MRSWNKLVYYFLWSLYIEVNQFATETWNSGLWGLPLKSSLGSLSLHLLIDFKHWLGIYVLEQGQDLTEEQMSE